MYMIIQLIDTDYGITAAVDNLVYNASRASAGTVMATQFHMISRNFGS